MRSIPVHLLSQADQSKARADERIEEVRREIRADLIVTDRTKLWWELVDGWTEHTSVGDLAVALASALIKLADLPTEE